jgi:ABC-type molybdate transport system substrate-binding protein
MPTQDLPVIPAERADDLHHLQIAGEADLILFMAGNQFMVMEALLSAFKQAYPEVGQIFYETLPPGLELKQILSGGAVFDNQVLPFYPDIYSSVNLKAMQQLQAAGHIRENDFQLYLHNRLALMVPADNPANIRRVEDLGRGDVRVSQPDPANEDIAFHIMDMYAAAGGEELVRRIMEEKRAEGTTIMTVVHHRETPLRIARRTVDVGPVWATEIRHARSAGLACEEVAPGEALDQRNAINYYICRLQRAPHPENAARFMEFINGPEARWVYEKYGFIPHQGS